MTGVCPIEHWQPVSAYGHGARVFDLSFYQADERFIASASEDESARVWKRSHNNQAFEQVSFCTAGTSEVLRVKWIPDVPILATGCSDGTVQLWGEVTGETENRYSGELKASLEGPPEEVYAIDFIGAGAGPRGAGAQSLIAGISTSLLLWDVETKTLLQEALPELGRDVQDPRDKREAGAPLEEGPVDFPPYVFSVAVHPGGHLVASHCCDGVLRLWCYIGAKLTLIREVVVHSNDMGSVCLFTSSGDFLICLSKGGEIVVLDVRKLEAVKKLRTAGPILGATLLSREGQEWLLVVGGNNRVRWLDIWGDLGPPSGAGLPSHQYGGQLLCVTVSASHGQVACAGDVSPAAPLHSHASDPTTSLSSRGSGANIGKKSRGSGAVRSLDIGPDDTLEGLFSPLTLSSSKSSNRLPQSKAHLMSGRAPLFVWREAEGLQ